MVLAALLTEQKLRKARKEGLEQGREEVRLWEAWNRRRLEAEVRGETFAEPPPTNGHHDGTSRQA